ncbi:MAG: DUF814 domain-containing protein [Balneola sp.]
MNYYELKYLIEFIKAKILGKEIVISNTRYKNLIEFFIEGESGNHKLVYSTSPGNIALFLDYYSNPKQKNTISFFEEIYGLPITDIELADTDRIVTICLEQNYKLVFKVFSNSANVMLLQNDELIHSFKGGDVSDIEVPEEKEIDLFENLKKQGSVKQKITTLNPLIPRNNLSEIISHYNLEDFSDEDLVSFTKKLTESVEESPEWRMLENGNTALLNENILPMKTERVFESINDLVSFRYKNYSHTQRLKQQKGELTKQIKRMIKRVSSGLRNLDQADKGIERAEKYEKYGHLLMANGHVKPDNPKKIQVTDLYNEGNEVEIPLDKKLSVIENAEKYYSKSKSSIRSYEEALERIPKLEKKKAKLVLLEEELGEITSLRDLNDWKKGRSSLLNELNVGEKESSNDQTLPFHVTEIGDCQIWIGKNAKSNDKLIRMAHKEDIWLHARGVAGSHALIRMENNKGMPSKAVLLEAASFAAFNSKAKGAEIVPVIITKMKYVRKPKGAPAGAVLVEKEEVEFVTPKKPKQ